MKKASIVFAALAAAATTFAAPSPTVGAQAKNPVKKMSRAEMEAAKYAATGGMIVKPGTPKGRICFLNAQRLLPESEIRAAIAVLKGGSMRFAVDVEDVTPSSDFAALKASAKAAAAVIVVADDITPGLLAAPEDGWAVVNIKRLEQGLKTPAAKEKFFAPRCRKELLRGFAAAAGGFGSSYQNNIMNVSKIEDLDLCDEFFPYDKYGVISKHLISLGLVPEQRVPYRKAVMDGWAPAPTNDVQKAVWDKVHAMPTEPIKIKPETKKVKE